MAAPYSLIRLVYMLPIKNSSYIYAGSMINDHGKTTWKIDKKSKSLKYTAQILQIVKMRQDNKIYRNSNPLQENFGEYRISSRIYFSEESGSICIITKYYGKKKMFFINFDDIVLL